MESSNHNPQMKQIVEQALGHIRSTADFAGLMGVLWGILFGAVVALSALSNLGIASEVVSMLLLQKLPSLVTSLLLGVRLVLFQSLEGDTQYQAVLQDVMAALWTALFNVVVFLLCAWIGYFVGFQACNAAFAQPALQELAQVYPIYELIRLCVKTAILACGLGWLGHLDNLILNRAQQSPSRSATRLLWLMVIWILLVEAIDSYLHWVLRTIS